MTKYVTREQVKRWQEIDDKSFELRSKNLEKEVQKRLEEKIAEAFKHGQMSIPGKKMKEMYNNIRDQVYQEQAGRDRKYDEYERATWGSC